MRPIDLRLAGLSDVEAVARLHRHVRKTSLPYLPDLHTPEEDAAYFRNVVFPSSAVWLAESGNEAVGFAAARPQWLDHLYVHPSWHGRGVGTALLSMARKGQTQLDLWTFQANAQARRFYERHGFRPVEMTDGAGNEERMPDIRYRWISD